MNVSDFEKKVAFIVNYSSAFDNKNDEFSTIGNQIFLDQIEDLFCENIDMMTSKLSSFHDVAALSALFLFSSKALKASKATAYLEGLGTENFPDSFWADLHKMSAISRNFNNNLKESHLGDSIVYMSNVFSPEVIMSMDKEGCGSGSGMIREIFLAYHNKTLKDRYSFGSPDDLVLSVIKNLEGRGLRPFDTFVDFNLNSFPLKVIEHIIENYAIHEDKKDKLGNSLIEVVVNSKNQGLLDKFNDKCKEKDLHKTAYFLGTVLNLTLDKNKVPRGLKNKELRTKICDYVVSQENWGTAIDGNGTNALMILAKNHVEAFIDLVTKIEKKNASADLKEEYNKALNHRDSRGRGVAFYFANSVSSWENYETQGYVNSSLRECAIDEDGDGIFFQALKEEIEKPSASFLFNYEKLMSYSTISKKTEEYLFDALPQYFMNRYQKLLAVSDNYKDSHAKKINIKVNQLLINKHINKSIAETFKDLPEKEIITFMSCASMLFFEKNSTDTTGLPYTVAYTYYAGSLEYVKNNVEIFKASLNNLEEKKKIGWLELLQKYSQYEPAVPNMPAEGKEMLQSLKLLFEQLVHSHELNNKLVPSSKQPSISMNRF